MELEGRQITKAKIGEEINKLLCNLQLCKS